MVIYHTALVCSPKIFRVKKNLRFFKRCRCSTPVYGVPIGHSSLKFYFTFLFCLGSDITAFLYSGAEIDSNWQLRVLWE